MPCPACHVPRVPCAFPGCQLRACRWTANPQRQCCARVCRWVFDYLLYLTAPCTLLGLQIELPKGPNFGKANPFLNPTGKRVGRRNEQRLQERYLARLRCIRSIDEMLDALGRARARFLAYSAYRMPLRTNVRDRGQLGALGANRHLPCRSVSFDLIVLLSTIFALCHKGNTQPCAPVQHLRAVAQPVTRDTRNTTGTVGPCCLLSASFALYRCFATISSDRFNGLLTCSAGA